MLHCGSPSHIATGDRVKRSNRSAKRLAVVLAILYFAAMTLAVTYPGVRLVNTIRPFVLGIPFVFAWYLAWIVGSLVVFLILHRTFSK